MLVKVFALLLEFLALSHKEPKSCLATVFGTPGDKHMGTLTACKPYKFDPDVIGIAHRTLPCGQKVLIANPRTGLAAVGTVIDRGPYGAIMDDGSWGKKFKIASEGKWRGCMDLTPALSKLLKHNGYENLLIRH